MEVDSKFQCMDINVKIRKFTWRIENFSSINDKKLYSEHFIVDGNKWRILIFPKGNKYMDYLSIYLDFADSATLPLGWSRYAQFGIAVIDQIDRKTSITKVTAHEFKAKEADWGFASFLPLGQLHNPGRGYLVDDACLVEAYVSTDRTRGLISHELIVETDWDKYKTKDADCVKTAFDNHKASVTKPVEITRFTTPSSSHSQRLLGSVAIEPEEPTEEDMNTFFTSLESELSSYGTVFSQEEAKEALAKVDEALCMTPVDFYNSGKVYPLKHAFNILASFDCSSIPLTIEQKNELLAMEERLKELADRAAKAMQDKHHFTENQSMKLAITRNLDSNLIRYKEVDSEVKQVEKKLAALLAERKEIFRSSKEIKMELEALENKWPGYEAKAKVDEEEKTVEAEWGRMKDFISYIKGKF